MRISKCLLLFAIVFIVSVNADAQSDKGKAKELGDKAVALEDEGKADDALPMLYEAHRLDPQNYRYQYEEAYCYYGIKKDYKKALGIMKDVMAYTDVGPDCYQMLGNIYDDSGDSAMALKTYTNGLKKFPKAGRLYLETGNVYRVRKDYNKALSYYENGIDADPAYASNYFRAAELFLSSSESLWGMVYGEIFMNLERNTDRTSTMSKWLYDNYKSHITIHSKDSMEVNFSRTATMNVDEQNAKSGKEMHLPFSMIYEPLILISLATQSVTEINAESLCAVRKSFIHFYYEREFDKKYPNPLFEYQHTIEKAGFLDAYNHWILMKGDDDTFRKWEKDHQDQWDGFVKWFTGNPLRITSENKIIRQKA